MAARHFPRLSLASALLAAGLLAAPAQAQRIIDLETSEGTISVRLFDHIALDPFVDLFLANRSSLTGALFHRSDKNLQCGVDSCSCVALVDCMPHSEFGKCENMEEPVFTCDDGDLADCECEDASPDASFMCVPENGADFECPNPDTNDFVCTCDDGSFPKLACEDESTPPGTCTEPLVQTDQTMPSAAIYLGLYRLDDDGDVLALPDYIPAENQDSIGIFENDAMTIAFVRDDLTGNITSQVIINVEDNSDPFDGETASEAYLVFGAVLAGQNVVDAISRISTLDLFAENDDGGIPPAEIFLSCENEPPAPLPSWIRGIPDTARCDSDDWDQFPILDFTGAEPIPPINGCVPGDADCQLPPCMTAGTAGGCDVPFCPEIAILGGIDRCTAPLLPECLELGETFQDTDGNNITPCLDPVCEDTVDAMGTPYCTEEPLGPNFPLLVPEPTTGLLGAAAVTVVTAIRRSRRRQACG